MKNILIIGGGGYIGTVVSKFLLEKGYKVKVLDNFIYNNSNATKDLQGLKNFSLINGDLCLENGYQDLMRDTTDVIILGGLVGDPITKKYPKESKFHNFDYISKIIKISRENKNLDKFIFISTCSNYGIVKKNIFAKETQKLKPLSLYAKQKVNIEKLLLRKKNKSINPIILRFATAFGLSKRMRFDLTVNQFVKDLFLKKNLVVYDANTWRPYCHVKDFCRLIYITIMSNNKKIIGQVFNAGGDKNNFTKKGIVNLVKKKIKKNNIFFKK